MYLFICVFVYLCISIFVYSFMYLCVCSYFRPVLCYTVHFFVYLCICALYAFFVFVFIQIQIQCVFVCTQIMLRTHSQRGVLYCPSDSKKDTTLPLTPTLNCTTIMWRIQFIRGRGYPC